MWCFERSARTRSSSPAAMSRCRSSSECCHAARGAPVQHRQASATTKETTVPPKRLGPECHESAMESTRSSPRPWASLASGRRSRTFAGNPGLCTSKLALRRAVLRSAVSALEANWSPRDAELCEDPHHGSAFVAWELLARWGSLEDDERWEQLDFLQFVLQESRALTMEQIDQVLDMAKSVACWDLMMGGWLRDPLLERFQAVRDEFADAACGCLGSPVI